MNMDNKISFIAGWFLTTATTITAMGLFKAAIIGLVGGFFGLFGKEVYYHTRKKTVQYTPVAKAWVASKIVLVATKIAWIKSKIVLVATKIATKIAWIKSKF